MEALREPKSHTHAHWVRRPWWRYRLYWDKEDRLVRVIVQDRVEVDCPSAIIPTSEIRVERELIPERSAIRVVGARQFWCERPIVGDNASVLLYAASELSAGKVE
jgi:YD repeat-containing protein